MKIAILDTYYPAFLDAIYLKQADLGQRRYTEQVSVLVDQCFGTSDFYSRHFNDAGCEAVDLIANGIQLQARWAEEHNHRIGGWRWRLDPRVTRLPGLGLLAANWPALIAVTAEQVRRLKPDVLYCQDMSFMPPRVLKELKRHVGLIVGQIASPAPALRYLECFDLILTSFPHFVERFRAQGLASEYFRIGFDTRVLEKLGAVPKDLDATFVGGITAAHSRGTALLEQLASTTPIEFFGYGSDRLAQDSPIRARHHGEVWGLDMYKALARSRVTLNRHIDVAENYANNMRLFESTGVGTLLITDQKKNLADLFEPGREVVTYSSAEEAAEMIRYYVEHPQLAEDIALAGQRRTLREHTYRHRIDELVGTLRKHLQ